MRKIFLAMVLVCSLLTAGWADAPVTIFRVQVDAPNPGYAYNAIQDVNYEGTIFFSNNSSSELHNVQLRVTLYDRVHHTYGPSADYSIGTVGPGAVANRGYRITTASEVYLVPVARLRYDLNGVTGEQKTSPTQNFY